MDKQWPHGNAPTRRAGNERVFIVVVDTASRPPIGGVEPEDEIAPERANPDLKARNTTENGDSRGVRKIAQNYFRLWPEPADRDIDLGDDEDRVVPADEPASSDERARNNRT